MSLTRSSVFPSHECLFAIVDIVTGFVILCLRSWSNGCFLLFGYQYHWFESPHHLSFPHLPAYIKPLALFRMFKVNVSSLNVNHHSTKLASFMLLFSSDNTKSNPNLLRLNSIFPKKIGFPVSIWDVIVNLWYGWSIISFGRLSKLLVTSIYLPIDTGFSVVYRPSITVYWYQTVNSCHDLSWNKYTSLHWTQSC